MTIAPPNAAAWRQSMGYTQTQLALALGLSRRTVQHMEKGSRLDGSPIQPKDWQRYRLLCAGLMLTGEREDGSPWPIGGWKD